MPFSAKAILPLALVAIALPAFGQDTPAPATDTASAASGLPMGVLMEIDQDSLIVEPFNITIDELDGMMIFSSDGTEFGEIEAVLGDTDGQISAFAIEIGGFLGVGDRQVIVPVSLIQPDGLRLTVQLTAAEMEQHTFWAE